MNRRPWRVATVTAFGCALAAQGFFSFAVKPEPYPSIRMPSFGPAAATDGTFEVILARAEAVDTYGHVVPVSPTELMSTFRFSTARPSYDYMFMADEGSRVNSNVKAWLQGRVRELVPGYDPVEVRMCWQRTIFKVADSSIKEQEPCEWQVVKLP